MCHECCENGARTGIDAISMGDITLSEIRETSLDRMTAVLSAATEATRVYCDRKEIAWEDDRSRLVKRLNRAESELRVTQESLAKLEGKYQVTKRNMKGLEEQYADFHRQLHSSQVKAQAAPAKLISSSSSSSFAAPSPEAAAIYNGGIKSGSEIQTKVQEEVIAHVNKEVDEKTPVASGGPKKIKRILSTRSAAAAVAEAFAAGKKRRLSEQASFVQGGKEDSMNGPAPILEATANDATLELSQKVNSKLQESITKPTTSTYRGFVKNGKGQQVKPTGAKETTPKLSKMPNAFPMPRKAESLIADKPTFEGLSEDSYRQESRNKIGRKSHPSSPGQKQKTSPKPIQGDRPGQGQLKRTGSASSSLGRYMQSKAAAAQDTSSKLQRSATGPNTASGRVNSSTGLNRRLTTGSLYAVSSREQPYVQTHLSKDARAQLPGRTCDECEAFYKMQKAKGFSSQDIQEVLNSCSRHRQQWTPTGTPEGFWDLSVMSMPTPEPPKKRPLYSQSGGEGTGADE